MAIVDAVQTEPMGLAGLTEATGLSRATAHRLASALVTHGILRRTDDARFTLGWRLVTLGRAAEAGQGFLASAQPVLDDLRDTTGESSQLYLRDGNDRVCVAASESAHGLRTIVGVGAVLPIDRGSAGHVLLGETPARGWIDSVAEREVGVASVSAPVHDAGGTLTAAIGVSGPIDRIGRRPGRRHGTAVVAAAGRLEARLRPR